MHQKFAGLIPGQGTYLGCKFDPGPGVDSKQPIDVSSHVDVSLLSSLPLSLQAMKKCSQVRIKKQTHTQWISVNGQ